MFKTPSGSTHNSGGHGPHASSKLHGTVIPRERKWNISERKKKKQYQGL
ncbi:hypothetical protein Patl1_25317 [Pistacia atlantica]|uniref:Uncharacterized protein n=1 Tax=Pistacia atlantica TaxID=434234 RepID=A0ACC1B2F4_9ROSI|nr:hypothetical protein Patl1_25317 [Pistacia atlantica]